MRTDSPAPRVANLAMAGFCRFFLLEIDEAFADFEAARALAIRLGNRHAEMFTLEGQGSLLIFCDRYTEGLPFVERGIALAEAIGAKRYQGTLHTERADALHALGRADEARVEVERALALFRETGMRFWGPLALGLRARLADRRARTRGAIARKRRRSSRKGA